MDIKEFYELDSRLVSLTFQALPIGLKKFHPIELNEKCRFDETKLIEGDYSGISFPVIFKQESGKKMEDVLDTGSVSLFLISDKMKTVLEENALTGWKTFEVKVLNKKGMEIQGYHGLSITGRCGKIDYSKSEVIKKRAVPNGPLGKHYKGLHVGLDQWDNSDFFLPEGNLGIIITSRAAEILKKNKLTNIRLSNLAEIETFDSIVQNE